MKLPFSIEIPPRPISPEPVPVSLKEVEELRATLARLEKQKEELQSNLNEATRENMVLKRKSDQRKEMLAKSQKKNKV